MCARCCPPEVNLEMHLVSTRIGWVGVGERGSPLAFRGQEPRMLNMQETVQPKELSKMPLAPPLRSPIWLLSSRWCDANHVTPLSINFPHPIEWRYKHSSGLPHRNVGFNK